MEWRNMRDGGGRRRRQTGDGRDDGGKVRHGEI